MGSFLKADRKETFEIVTPPADHLCNLCDGNDRGLYAKVLRESEDVEAEISEEAKQNKGLPCGVKPKGRRSRNTTGLICHSGLGANTVCLEKDNHTHTTKKKRKK